MSPNPLEKGGWKCMIIKRTVISQLIDCTYKHYIDVNITPSYFLFLSCSYKHASLLHN